jgi:hypothetical protein
LGGGDTGVSIQGLHLEPLHQTFFVMGFFDMGSHELFAWASYESWASWSLPPEYLGLRNIILKKYILDMYMVGRMAHRDLHLGEHNLISWTLKIRKLSLAWSRRNAAEWKVSNLEHEKDSVHHCWFKDGDKLTKNIGAEIGL